MIAAGADGDDFGFSQSDVEGVQFLHNVIEVERADDRHITDIGDARQLKRDDLRLRVVVEHVA